MSTLGFHDGFSSASTYEPVASSFFGLRAFTIDDGRNRASLPDVGPTSIPATGGQVVWPRPGALRSIFRTTYIWGPGTNTAECLRAALFMPRSGVAKHEAVVADCDCGFWAYTFGKHVLQVNGTPVFGVIQGWGKVVVGPHGFRAEKARIVGLCFDIDAIDDAPTPVVLRSSNMILSAIAVVARIFGIPPSMVATTPLPPPQAAAIAAKGHPLPNTPSLRQQAESIYRDIPVFPTVGAMLRAFPLTDLTPLLPPVKPDCDTEEES